MSVAALLMMQQQFNLSSLQKVGSRSLQAPGKHRQSVFDDLNSHFEGCKRAVDYTQMMAQKVPAGLDVRRSTDYMTTMRVLQGGLQGMQEHIVRMWTIDTSNSRWRAELRILGDTIVGMHLIAVSTCDELGALIGRSCPTFKKLLAAVHLMDRFQALMRKHGPKAILEKRRNVAEEVAAEKQHQKKDAKRQREIVDQQQLDEEANEARRLLDEAKAKRQIVLEAKQEAKRKKREEERLQREEERMRRQKEEEEKERKRQEEEKAKQRQKEEEERERKRQEKERNKIKNVEDWMRQAASIDVVDDWSALAVPDWALGAHEQVAELATHLEISSKALVQLRRAYGVAFKMLHSEDWNRFLEAPTVRVHGDDKATHSTPSWTSLLQGGKNSTMRKGGNVKAQQLVSKAQVLFLGDPPTGQLCKIFQSNGWKGLSAACGDVPINSDTWCEITNAAGKPADLCRWCDVTEGIATWCENPEVPPTATFKSQIPHSDFHLIYINSMFQGIPAKNLGNEHVLPLIGKVPVPIRKDRYRARLREFREHLYIALQRLADGGALCLAWSGSPYHPVLFFIMSHLHCHSSA